MGCRKGLEGRLRFGNGRRWNTKPRSCMRRATSPMFGCLRRVLRTKYMVQFPGRKPLHGRQRPRAPIRAGGGPRGHCPAEKRGRNPAIVRRRHESTQVAQLDGFSWVDPYAVSPYEWLVNRAGALGPRLRHQQHGYVGLSGSARAAADYVIFVGGLDQSQEGENYPRPAGGSHERFRGIARRPTGFDQRLG